MRRLIFLIIFIAPLMFFTAKASAKFELIQAKGSVNRSEVGHGDLFVVSFWSNGRQAVLEDNSFTTLISNQRPQKVSLIDNENKTRGLAICLPDHADNIIFDARSTALAVLFGDPKLFGQTQDVVSLCKRIEPQKSFQDLVAFLKINLPDKPLEELNKNEAYVALLERCGSEIFGQDKQEISRSLNSARKELEKVLQ